MSTKEGQGYKPLIMVVDDNPEFLDGIELTLEMEGFDVWKASDGKNALDQLEKAVQVRQTMDASGVARLPDLILADMMTPVMDGYEFYDHVQNNPLLNSIPFIFLTAKSSDENIRHGKELGVDDYLPKLASTEDLLASVRGKLTRVEKKRSLAAQIMGNPGERPMGGFLIAIAIIGALVSVAFCIGVAVTLGLTG